MKTMLFAFLLVCAFAWTFAVEEVTVNAHKMLADKFGLTKLKQLLKDHDIDLDQVTAEGSNLRGVEVEEAVATQAAEPRFAYIALFGADDCSGPITYMQSLRFDICQTIQARNSYRLVYTGLHNGDHGIDMEIFNNRNCRGDPVGKDKFGDAPDTCDKGFQGFVAAELPDLENFAKPGVRTTVSTSKAACMTQAAGAADIPDADIEEMFYAPVGVCMQDGRDSMFAGCTTDGTTSTFKLRRYESYDGSCKGPYKLLTRTTADDCKRGSETFEKLGIGHMTWTCNK